MAMILDGKVAAKALYEGLQQKINHSHKLTLTILLVGENAASLSYIKGKEKAGAVLGINTTVMRLPTTVTTEQLVDQVKTLNQDTQVTGILVQLPLPSHIDPQTVINAIDPKKDVDGLTDNNMGKLLGGRPSLVPATARGIMALLKYYNVAVEGQNAVIVGRSNLVGLPTALLLQQQGATITITHRQTKDLIAVTKTADILVCAVGHPGLITNEHVKLGAAIIDVGITRTPDGLKGDVDAFRVQSIASALSPVPGGVGPLTVACLFENVYQASQL